MGSGSDSVNGYSRWVYMHVASSVNERVFSHWKNILGAHRTNMGKKRQRDAVFVYSNERVLKRSDQKASVTIASESESEE